MSEVKETVETEVTTETTQDETGGEESKSLVQESLEASKPDAVEAEESGEGDKSDEAEGKDSAPDSYDLTFPDGVEVNDEQRALIEGRFKELNLTQDQASAVVELHGKFISEQAEAVKGIREQWRSEVMADPEIGGANWKKSQQNIGRALTHVQGAAPEFSGLLESMGLGDNPAVLKVLNHFGAMLAEDSVGGGTPSSGSKPATLAEKLYSKIDVATE